MWVPAHMKHMFWAGMKTTQRSESINSFFDGYVKKQTQLHEFISQYFAAMEARVYAEKSADADSTWYVQELVTDFPIEAEFRKFYTNNKFKEFQAECLKLVYVNMFSKRQVSENLVEHQIEDRVWHDCSSARKDVITDQYREYTVTLDLQNNHAWCGCKLFECNGIMCRHLIRVFAHHRIKKLPDYFILRR